MARTSGPEDAGARRRGVRGARAPRTPSWATGSGGSPRFCASGGWPRATGSPTSGPNHPAFLETFFATAALGAVFVPLNTRLAAPELSYMLDDSGARLLVFGPEHAETVAGLALRDRIAVAGEYEELLAGAPAEPIDVPVSLDDVCMIMYTSGTTGHPKGAMLTHGNLTWNCYNLLVDLDLAGDDVALVSAPLFHTAALNHTALPVFLKGGTNVLVAQVRPGAVVRPDRRAPDHAGVRGAGDVPADRALAPLADARTCRRCASCTAAARRCRRR